MMSPNRNKGFGQLGKGQRHMGRSGRGLGYCSGKVDAQEIAWGQEGLDKTYDRFQKLISQLEIHGKVISQEDTNLKLLRSLPSAWNNIALIMKNKYYLDTLSMDDLYNNLKAYESEIKSQSSSSSNSQNVAFVSLDNVSGTNKTVNTAHSVSAASSKDKVSTVSYADDVVFSFFSNQSNALQLDNKDLEQIDTDDLEEMDLKWQVVMLTMRVKRFIKKIGKKLDLNGKDTGNINRDASTRNAPVDTSTTNALVIQDGIGGYDWSLQFEEELTNFSLMAYCKALNKSNLEIIGYQIGLESLEARIVVHEKYEAVYEEDIAFLKYDVQVKDISIKDLKNQLEKALKEKDDLKLKLEKFETSSKNLTKLLNSQISAIDKTGHGYDSQMNEIDLNDIHVNENEVLNNVVDSCESDRDDNQVNDRFKKDNSVFKSKVSETITSVHKIKTNASKTSKDSLEKPKTVRPSAPLIEEWESDSEDENVFKPKEVKKIVKPSMEKIELVNARNTTLENENKAENPRKLSQSPRATVLTNSGQVLVNAAKQSSPITVASVGTARHVNTVVSRPNMNNALPTTYSYFKAHSPCNPQYALQDQGIFDSGCSRHMTGNNSYLTDYLEINGGFVAFGGNAKG
nr:hypothetical protein [Tanacetum cinerariifolium]